jgi:hypothetical protein
MLNASLPTIESLGMKIIMRKMASEHMAMERITIMSLLYVLDKNSLRKLTLGQMSFHRIMALIAMAFIWTGSQIPVYIFGWFSHIFHVL